MAVRSGHLPTAIAWGSTAQNDDRRTKLAEQAEYKVFEMTAWRRGVLVRQVRALQEADGWALLNTGDPLPFEDVERYKKRQINARLDCKLIDNYSEAVGYGISSVTQFDGQCWHFWRSR